MTSDYISEHDGMTLAETARWNDLDEAQWRDQYAIGADSMGTVVTIDRKPDGVVLVGSGLRPAGQTVGISFLYTPDGATEYTKSTGGSGKVRDNGTVKVVTDTYELALKDAADPGPVQPGTVKWWWHDGTDFWEPPIAADGGQGEFRVP